MRAAQVEAEAFDQLLLTAVQLAAQTDGEPAGAVDLDALRDRPVPAPIPTKAK